MILSGGSGGGGTTVEFRGGKDVCGRDEKREVGESCAQT
jgi:hypothetical protein